jgi:hypothetical protein
MADLPRTTFRRLLSSRCAIASTFHSSRKEIKMGRTEDEMRAALEEIRNRAEDAERLFDDALDERDELKKQVDDLRSRLSGLLARRKRPPATPSMTVDVRLRLGRDDLLAKLVTSGDEPGVASWEYHGVICRAYRTVAAGVTRTVVALVCSRIEDAAYISSFSVVADGRQLYSSRSGEPIRLTPGQAWVRSWYDGGSATQYWAARGQEMLRPVPDWAHQMCEDEARRIGDGPGLPYDRADAPGGDFGVSTHGEESFLCPSGLWMHAEDMEAVARRCRVFSPCTQDGTPEWVKVTGGHWASWGYPIDKPWDLPGEPYPGLWDFDGQHSPRGWRSAAMLQTIDPFAHWYLRCWANRSALQWGQTTSSTHNPLLRGINEVLDRIVPGRGSESLGREGLWAAYLSFLTDSSLYPMFARAIRKASHPHTGELLADKDPNALTWARDILREQGHEDWRTAPLAQTHEIAMGVALRKKMEVDLVGAAQAERLLIDTPGKCRIFGTDTWVGPVIPFVELEAGDFSNHGGSAESFLQICSTRSAMGSDQPLHHCPRKYWENAL